MQLNTFQKAMIIGLLAKPGQLPGYRVFIQQRIDSLYEPIRRLGLSQRKLEPAQRSGNLSAQSVELLQLFAILIAVLPVPFPIPGAAANAILQHIVFQGIQLLLLIRQ